MNCEQTRENLVLHRQGSMLTGTKRQNFLQHLRGCKACQMEYEGLWHTASLLGNLEAPVPPPDLLGKIQNQIRDVHKQSQTAFFANPISWLLQKFKIELSPQFVNGIALLCYLTASLFLVKIAFFTEKPTEDFGLTATAFEATRAKYARVSPSPWATLKHQYTKIDSPQPSTFLSEKNVSMPNQFVGMETSGIWYPRAINTGTETIDAHIPNMTKQKLALFWSDIKTDL